MIRGTDSNPPAAAGGPRRAAFRTSTTSLKKFGADPDWQTMRAESDADGRILIGGGVQWMFLNPTDFSPAR